MTFRDLYRPPAPADHFRVVYDLVPPPGVSLEEAALDLLLMTTQRTLRRSGHEPSVDSLGVILTHPRFQAGRGWATVEFALPPEVCRPEESLGHLLLVLTAGVEYRYTQKFWLRGVTLPEDYLRAFRGPRFGVEGIREVVGVEGRPPLGLSVKPRWGSTVDATANACEAALVGGVDFLVDDLLMGNPSGTMELSQRVRRFVSVCAKATRDTGQVKTYWPYITGRPTQAYEAAQFAASAGVGGLVVDAWTSGFGFLEELVDIVDGAVPVITTNMGSGVASRVPEVGAGGSGPEDTLLAGVDEAVIALLSRVGGADGVHVGTTGAECAAVDWHDPVQILYRPLASPLRPSFRVAEGDLGIESLWENLDLLREDHRKCDVMIEAANAILGYRDPNGRGDPRAGASLFRRVLNEVWQAPTREDADAALFAAASRDEALDRYLRERRYFSVGNPS